MMRINGDIIPRTSGVNHIGINAAGATAFDISSLAPVGHIHMLSGVFHDPVLGESGVLRYSKAAGAFQFSVNGGFSFANILSTTNSVQSIGVMNGPNLFGNIDIGVPTSGFMTIQYTASNSPLLFSVDSFALSGLWGFPTQGFNGRVVNALTDSNGTEVQGIVNVVGASGIVVDIIGQTLTITPGNAPLLSIGVLGDANLVGNVDLATPASGFMTINDTGDASPLLFAVDVLGLSGLYGFPTQGFNGRIVNTLGILGGANLTGEVDVASASSGFIAITDNGGASPISFAVAHLSLSGFWGFPTQGFNGRVVNALTDANGTEVQGVVSVVGVSGILVDIIGQTMTITPGNGLPKSYSNTFASAISWTVSHNLNSSTVMVQTFDNSAARLAIEPDDIEITDANTVTIRWNEAQAGLAVVIAV